MSAIFEQLIQETELKLRYLDRILPANRRKKTPALRAIPTACRQTADSTSLVAEVFTHMRSVHYTTRRVFTVTPYRSIVDELKP